MPTHQMFLTDCRVTLLASPLFREPEHLRCEWCGEATDGERLSEYAGRVCYLSYENPANRTTKEYLDNIMQHEHGSVLEHAHFSFLIEGISRTCSHEIVRHRAGFAYSQQSQRYVDESACAFVVPPALLDARGTPEGEHQYWRWQEQMLRALAEYKNQVNDYSARLVDLPTGLERRKRAREAARSVLPNATETKLVMTGNGRAWRHFITMRTGWGADREIRRLALKLQAELAAQAPRMFGDFSVFTAPDGAEAGMLKYKKV